MRLRTLSSIRRADFLSSLRWVRDGLQASGSHEVSGMAIVQLRPGEPPPRCGDWLLVTRTSGDDFAIMANLEPGASLLTLGKAGLLDEAIARATRTAAVMHIDTVYTAGVTPS